MQTVLSRLVRLVLPVFMVTIGAVWLPQTNATGLPDYRGKVLLVMANDVAQNTSLQVGIARLIQDLRGDGWRVLVHKVDRSPDFDFHAFDDLRNNPIYYDYTTLSQGHQAHRTWSLANATQARMLRALIRADHAADPEQVKAVLLLGHLAVPLSGDMGSAHPQTWGAHPADLFYADMTTHYGPRGWTDSTVDNWPTSATKNRYPGQWPNWDAIVNEPHDGKFDQESLPSAIQLAVGRVDFYGMTAFESAGITEATSLSRYLAKNHDFRHAEPPYFSMMSGSAPRGLYVGAPGIGTLGYDAQTATDLSTLVGQNLYLQFDNEYHWFPNASSAGQECLIGFGSGGGSPRSCCGIGVSYPEIPPCGGSTANNNFLTVDSRVAFVGLFGSIFYDWAEEDGLLRAVLANPYYAPTESTGRHGYAVASFRHERRPHGTAWTAFCQGGTVGDALCLGDSTTPLLTTGLMGDPTLRLHSVAPPTTASVSVNNPNDPNPTVNVSWGPSPDSGVTGYRIYRSTTRSGRFYLVDTSTPSSIPRATSGAPDYPDNFYMVRAVKTQTLPSGGSYVNMSEGIIAPCIRAPVAKIVADPVDVIASLLADGTTRLAALTVDAVGCATDGSEELTYQWYKKGPNDSVITLTDSASVHGANTRALTICPATDSDEGEYYVVAQNSSTQDSSALAQLTVNTVVAQDDSAATTRGTAIDIDVLANDTLQGDITFYASETWMLSSPTWAGSPGTMEVTSEGKIRFSPDRLFVGTAYLTYIIWDGVTASQATVTINVNKVSNDPPNVVPATIPDQTMTEDGTLDISFTASDLVTPPEYLRISAVCSDPVLIPDENSTATGTGTSKVLHIKGGQHRYGNGTVTLTVKDEDGNVTSRSFGMSISPATIPTLRALGFSGSLFQIGAHGPAGSVLEIRRSDDLVSWTYLGRLTLTGNEGTFVDNTDGVTFRCYSAQSDDGRSANIIGFNKFFIQAGSSALIAHQFDAPPNRLSTLLPTPNCGVTFAKYVTGSGWNSYCYDVDDAAWSGDPTFALGEGALVSSPLDLSFALMGDVCDSQQGNPVPAGNCVRGSVVPKSGGICSILGYTPSSGDQVRKWVAGTWGTPYTFNGSWTPSEPVLGIGEACFITSTEAKTWTTSYTGWGAAPTLTSGQLTAGQFQMVITGTEGDSVLVESSDNLLTWSARSDVTISQGQAVFADTQVTGIARRFYRARTGFLRSANCLGFIRQSIPTGWSTLANHLDNGTGNYLSQLLNSPAIPTGTLVKKWNAQTQQYEDRNLTSSGWSPDDSLAPGEGALIQNQTSSEIQVAFVGELPQGNLAQQLPANVQVLVSSMVPMEGNLSELGLSDVAGELVYRYNVTTHQWVSSMFDPDDLVWSPSEPGIGVGEAIFLKSPSARSWAQPFSVWGPRLSNGSFVNSGQDFQLRITTGPALDATAQIEASADLQTWASVGSALIQNGVASFLNNNQGSTSARFYRARAGLMRSPNSVGFTRLTVPSGYSTLANQLDNGAGNRLSQLLPSVPVNTVLSKWNATTQQYESRTYTSSAWSSDGTLAPGEGALVQNTSGASMQVVFTGEVQQGTLAIQLLGNQSVLVSSRVPQSGTLPALGLPPVLGDQVYLYTTGQGWSSTLFDPDDGVWTPFDPSLSLGECMFIRPTVARTWTRTFSVWGQ